MRLVPALLALLAAPLPAQRARPNVVVLLADDHAAHALSAYRAHLPYGTPLPPTPNLDRLAGSGVLFANAFVTNAICGPSRASILTGQYGHLNGVMTNAEPLHPAKVTWPGLLRDAGYRTALFGKWHLHERPSGFTHYEMLPGQGTSYNPVLVSGRGDSVRHEGYTNDVVTDRAIAWMGARAAERGRARAPFALLLAFNAPHRYWDPGPAQLGRFRDTTFAEPATFWDDGAGRAFPTRDAEMTIARDLFARDLKLEAPGNLTPAQRLAWDSAYARENAAYRALDSTSVAAVRWKYQRFIADYMRAVLALDAAVGRVLDALDRGGLARNTVVVYTSDQGFFLGDHGWFDKRWMYEESQRTPLLVRWPGVTRAGAVNRDLVMTLDLAHTVLDAAGVRAPASMQGSSLTPLLRGRTPAGWRDAVYYQYFAYPDWHMVQRQYGVRTHRHKLIHYYEAGRWELFDLELDPHELRSVYDDPRYAATADSLKARLAGLRARYAVPERDPVPHRPFEALPGMRRPAAERPTRHRH